jgi:tetratricopeptide (TPR) repeat protein
MASPNRPESRLEQEVLGNMPVSPRFHLALTAAWLAWAHLAIAQGPERPAALVPAKVRTKKEFNRREALKLYTLALVCQREDRIVEAVRHLERAAVLDPESAPVQKGLAALYVALERPQDALKASKRALELGPADYEMWFNYARQLKARGQTKEACTALARGARCPGLKEHPDVLQQMQFERGVLHEGLREYDRALEAFGQAVKVLEKPEALLEAGPFDRKEINARAADLLERMGRLALRLRRYDQAVAAFRRAQAKAGDWTGRLDYNLAEVYYRQHQYAQALRHLNGYLRLQPQGTEGYELKITLLGLLGRRADIVRELQRHTEKDRFNVGLKLLLAKECGRSGNVAQAERIYLKLAERGASAELYKGLFHLYRDAPTRGMENALELLDKTLKDAADKDKDRTTRAAAAARARAMLIVLRDDPALVKPLLHVAGRDLRSGKRLGYETRGLLAVLAGRAGRLDQAEQLYRDCLADTDPRNEAAVYGGLLKVLWEAHKYAAVVEVCRQGLRKTQATNHVLFHLDLARALPLLGKMDEAVKHADEAVKLSGDDIRLITRLRRVTVLTLAERYGPAAAECRDLLKEYGKPAEVHDIRYALSNVYTASKNYPKAEAELERLIRDYPDDPTAYNDLGYIWADRGKNLDKAEEYIRKALDLDRKQRQLGAVIGTDQDRDNAAYIDSLGWVLFRRGHVADARREMEKASSLPGGDDDPVVWDHLGDVYARLDEAARARTAWQKAVVLYEVQKRRQMDDRYREIKKKLKLLEQDTQP